MKNITPKQIRESIVETAISIKRKMELYKEVKRINNEIKSLNEGMGFAGTWGFKTPEDASNRTITGFKDDNFQQISHIAELAEEMKNEEEVDELTELDVLKKENERLRAELNEEKDKKKPSAGLTKKQKSNVVKKAKAGEDIGKPGKGFEAIEKKAKEYGYDDPAAVAASVMWKSIKRKK